jgi:hypothetical protein
LEKDIAHGNSCFEEKRVEWNKLEKKHLETEKSFIPLTQLISSHNWIGSYILILLHGLNEGEKTSHRSAECRVLATQTLACFELLEARTADHASFHVTFSCLFIFQGAMLGDSTGHSSSSLMSGKKARYMPLVSQAFEYWVHDVLSQCFVEKAEPGRKSVFLEEAQTKFVCALRNLDSGCKSEEGGVK